MEEKNIRILLQYDGTRYDGWQKQGNTQQTVQGKLEAVLSRLAGGPVEVHGSGRTDAGVHALGQVANFHLPLSAFCGSQTEAADMLRIKNYLNEYLPEDIRVLAAEEARPRFHSRLNALSKTYIYRIETADKNDVFERKYRYGLGKEPDLEIMKRAASILVGTHDFRAFSSLKKTKKSTVRTISRIDIRRDGTQLEILLEGNGFLYNMVRIIVGTLVESGLLERSVQSVKEALESLDRSLAGKTAPAKGLFLSAVAYEEKIFQSVQ